MDLDQRGNVVQVAAQEGGILTFGDQPFTWEELDAAPGGYVVGLIVEDLDGNAYEVHEEVFVEQIDGFSPSPHWFSSAQKRLGTFTRGPYETPGITAQEALRRPLGAENRDLGPYPSLSTRNRRVLAAPIVMLHVLGRSASY